MNGKAKFYSNLALDCDVAADRTQAVMSQIQSHCLKDGEPTYHYSQDMQELTAAFGKLTILADRYRRQAAQR